MKQSFLKSAFISSALLLSLVGSNAFAAHPADARSTTGVSPVPNNQWALGAFLGNLTGATVRKNIGTTNGLQASFGRALGMGYTVLTTDYTWTLMEGLSSTGLLSRLSPYIGVGPGLKIRDTTEVTNEKKRLTAMIRVPVGLEWNPVDVPVGIFAEVATGLDITPTITGQVLTGAGARVYF